jgi:hypothetical protein
VDVYHAMLERGILRSGDPVELLEGFIVQKPVKNPPHCLSNRAARRALESVIPSGWYVADQAPITLFSSEPEPDVSVIRGRPRSYLRRHPGIGEVALSSKFPTHRSKGIGC